MRIAASLNFKSGPGLNVAPPVMPEPCQQLASVYRYAVYSGVAIQTFADRATERFFITGYRLGVGWASVHGVVKRKLDMLHYATKLADLRSPPGNRLEALKGRLKGTHSIRINDQWRVVFHWTEAGPSRVRVTD